ncbi:hypothetical protein [Inquilinus sp. CA228]|uniref:hypothetical protein n=1 Tax=Inquilinus sp. CA228 TaxID=3455609 RepID=UPI003F8CF625
MIDVEAPMMQAEHNVISVNPLVRVGATDSGAEIVSAPGTVWIDDGGGHRIGHFDGRGFEILHRRAEFWRPGRDRLVGRRLATTEDDWQHFRALMLEHHGIVIPDGARPGFLSPSLAAVKREISG